MTELFVFDGIFPANIQGFFDTRMEFCMFMSVNYVNFGKVRG